MFLHLDISIIKYHEKENTTVITYGFNSSWPFSFQLNNSPRDQTFFTIYYHSTGTLQVVS